MEDNNKDNDNNKDDNNYKGSSALGHDRDLGFCQDIKDKWWIYVVKMN